MTSFNHIMHPYEMYDMRLSELAKVLIDVSLDRIELFEKLDGIRLGACSTFSVDIRFWRSLADLRNGGLEPGSLAGRFSAASLDDVVPGAAQSIREAVKLGILNVAPQSSFSMELLTRHVRNVLAYDVETIVVHDAGVVKVPCDVSGWNIRGPIRVNVNADEATLSAVNLCIGRIASLPVSEGMQQQDPTIGDVITHRLCTWLEHNGFSSTATMSLARRVLNVGSDVPSLTGIKKAFPRMRHGDLSDLVKRPSRAIRWARRPLESVVQDVGDAVLKNVSSGLIADAGAERTRLQSLLVDVRGRLMANSEERSKWESVLNDVKQVNAIEGVVFLHRGTLMKLTGSFAPFNQAHGSLRHAR